VDSVLLSHADADHIGGLLQILACEAIDVRRVYLNADATKKSAAWDDLVWELDLLSRSKKLELFSTVTRGLGETLSRGETVVEILGPRPYLALKGAGALTRSKKRIRSNSLSVVVRLVRAGLPLILLPGDLDHIGLAALVEDEIDIHAQILVYPHHGGRSGGSEASFAKQLCSLVEPRVIVFSIGRGRHRTPKPEVVAALRNVNPEVRIACTQLSEHCAEQVPASQPGHLLSVFSQGRQERKCCAGTIEVVLLDSVGRLGLFPDHDAHQTFIDSSAGTALCRRSSYP
jgi:competence protein ComEC